MTDRLTPTDRPAPPSSVATAVDNTAPDSAPIALPPTLASDAPPGVAPHAGRPVVPTLVEVRNAGYAPDVALRIVDEQTALATAWDAEHREENKVPSPALLDAPAIDIYKLGQLVTLVDSEDTPVGQFAIVDLQPRDRLGHLHADLAQEGHTEAMFHTILLEEDVQHGRARFSTKADRDAMLALDAPPVPAEPAVPDEPLLALAAEGIGVEPLIRTDDAAVNAPGSTAEPPEVAAANDSIAARARALMSPQGLGTRTVVSTPAAAASVAGMPPNQRPVPPQALGIATLPNPLPGTGVALDQKYCSPYCTDDHVHAVCPPGCRALHIHRFS